MPNTTHLNQTPCPRRQRGITLIELMIVVVIIAVIAAVAIPSYRQYTLESKRSDAHAALTTLQGHQERFYSENNEYAANNVITNAASGTPPGLGYLNTNSPNQFYTLSIAAGNTNSINTSYSLTATAQGEQLNDLDCRTLVLDSTGNRTGTNSGGSASDVCW